ncbi:MAG: hypothetical protein JNK65_02525 [Deltaproteobacteria bacterium]|nr:hypothetical protein [Deltaproteobacteria bacterium]
MKKMKIALIQCAGVDGEVEANAEQVRSLLDLVPSKTNYILLPEMWPSGFRVVEGEDLWKRTQGVLKDLAKWARRKRVNILGSHLEQKSGKYFNTLSLMTAQGEYHPLYRKVHLFSMGGEDQKFQAGDQMELLKMNHVKWGLGICYDLRFPEFFRAQVDAGASLFVLPSAWPKARIDHFKILSTARAIENQCFFISVNKVGFNAEGIEYGGTSSVIDPWGRTLLQMDEKPGVGIAQIDLSKVEKIRSQFPVLKGRRDEVYGKKVKVYQL